MMNNEEISLEEKIMLLINGKMGQNSYDECQSTQLSKELFFLPMKSPHYSS